MIDIEREYLEIKDKRIEGVEQILQHLNPDLNGEHCQKVFKFIVNDLVVKQPKKSSPNEFMKIIKNDKYKELDSILSNHKYLAGDQKSELDYVGFSYLSKYLIVNEKNQKQMKKLCGWFQELESENIQQYVEQLYKDYGSQDQIKRMEEIKVQISKEKMKSQNKKTNKTEAKENKQDKKQQKVVVVKKEVKKKDNIEEIPQEYQEQIKKARIIRSDKSFKVPKSDQKNVLITSALPYVNNIPHLGNIIGCVLSADVFSRFCRLNKTNSLYICGTDEYGTATEMKARQENLTPKQICDKYNQKHKEIYEWFDIDFDYFGRTSTQNQTEIAQKIFMDLYENGYLKEGSMMQQWCEKCEIFLNDRYIHGECPKCGYDDARGDQCDGCGQVLNSTELINPKCQLCNWDPIQRESDHLFLDLPTLQPHLEEFIKEQELKGNWAANTRNITNTWLKQGLQQRCITRDLKWGTPVPLEKYKNKVFYVWFDAPIGYISITSQADPRYQEWWKQTDHDIDMYQFMGKDNVPFHSVIFPSTLIGANVSQQQKGESEWKLVHHINTTEYLQYENDKFSKSRGTGVFGDNAQESGVSVECFRYYLLINRPEKSDTIFEWKDFQSKINNELMFNVGNLYNRIIKFIYNKYDKQVPQIDKTLLNIHSLQHNHPNEYDFIIQLHKMFIHYVGLLEKVEIKDSLRFAMEVSAFCNKYMQDNQPWSKEIQQEKRNLIIFVLMNSLRLVSVLFEPFMPSLSAKMELILNITRTEKDELLIGHIRENGEQALLELIEPGHIINQPFILVHPLSDEQIDSLRQRFKGQKQEEKPKTKK